MHKALSVIPALHKLDIVVPTYNPSTWMIEVGGSEVQDHSLLHSESEASLGYMVRL